MLWPRSEETLKGHLPENIDSIGAYIVTNTTVGVPHDSYSINIHPKPHSNYEGPYMSRSTLAPGSGLKV